MTIPGTPWQAKILSILVSQAGLAGAQYLAYLQAGGAWVTLGLALLQAIQGSIAAYGLDPWREAGRAVVRVGEAVRRARDDGPEKPTRGVGPGGPTPG